MSSVCKPRDHSVNFEAERKRSEGESSPESENKKNQRQRDALTEGKKSL